MVPQAKKKFDMRAIFFWYCRLALRPLTNVVNLFLTNSDSITTAGEMKPNSIRLITNLFANNRHV